MAQCHELLKDIKSAIGALDFAFIVAADAETQKCIREHRHRLEAQMQAQIEARKQATQRVSAVVKNVFRALWSLR